MKCMPARWNRGFRCVAAGFHRCERIDIGRVIAWVSRRISYVGVPGVQVDKLWFVWIGSAQINEPRGRERFFVLVGTERRFGMQRIQKKAKAELAEARKVGLDPDRLSRLRKAVEEDTARGL